MKTNLTKKNTLIAVAMEEELNLQQAKGWRVVYTGIGKVNALISINRAIREYKPVNIINFGTAGSSRSDLEGLHEVTTFKQRDMDLRNIGLPLGMTLNDDINDISLGRPGLSCGTGDSFVSSSQEIETDLYDMEAYALAKLCLIEDINFFCFKYISDDANESASIDWNKNVSKGGEAFSHHLENLDG
mgnify:CR=1 FL=1|tara:strand:+ start:2363 stop:2923 length:561 start_codon:yes stop_codon:yes gene_type:complete